MKVLWSREAVKVMKKLEKSISKRILKKIDLISDNPYPFMDKIITLDLWKVRVGEYRVIVKVEEDVMYVVTIGHRKNIYKKVRK